MIYIICPANTATGGPELLHQLGYKLRLLNFDACMYYYGMEENISPVPSRYEKYQVPYVNKIDDTLENIVIFPEITLGFLEKLKNALKVVWWLSVDNARCDSKSIKMLREDTKLIHLSQSQYATDFLVNVVKIAENRIYYLSDYINNEFLNVLSETKRENIVLFNPKKGFYKTAEIMKSANASIKWQVLNGITPKQMHEVMNRAKVYIDFGEHPGKDRMPREAAVSGCCIVTNRVGAASNNADIMIPERYKFEEEAGVKDILNTIYELMVYYEEKKSDYIDYVERTKSEFIEFEKSVLNIFEKLTNSNTNIFKEEEAVLLVQQELEQENYKEAFKILVKYRNLNYSDNIIIDILEANVRIGLGEYPEAEYWCKKGLMKDNYNYEILLLLAQICYLNGETKERNLEAIDYLSKALEYSQGSVDEKYVLEVSNFYLNEIEKRLNG